MLPPSLLLLLLLLALPALSQVPLPSPAWLPPDPSTGYDPSGNTTAAWSTLLGSLLYFYSAQSSGPASARVPWRNASALSDTPLVGGFYDAGDYLKCTYPLAWVLTEVCWGAQVVGGGYDVAGQTGYLDGVLRWGLDWLREANPDNETLYVQVGSADVDNNYWGPDTSIPLPRPQYQVNSSYPGTDVTSITSAAFSACSLLYDPSFNYNLTANTTAASLQNATYALILRDHALELYDLAVNADGGFAVYSDSVPEVADTYPSSGYGDDLTLSTLFLSLLTSSPSLASSAYTYYSNYTLSSYTGCLNWDSKVPAVYTLFTHLSLLRPTWSGELGQPLAKWQAEMERWADGVAAGSIGGAYFTPGGLIYFPDDSPPASLNPALEAAMILTLYAPVASSDEKAENYIAFIESQVGYVLGDNPMNVPYVVGMNPNSPNHVHSALASGGTSITSIDTSPAGADLHVLYGAIVGGPDAQDRFWNLRSDWAQSEPALDYSAPMLTLAAYFLLAQPGNPPFYLGLAPGAYVVPAGAPCDEAVSTGCGNGLGGLSQGGKIAVGVVVSVVGLAVLGMGGWWVWRIVNRRGKH